MTIALRAAGTATGAAGAVSPLAPSTPAGIQPTDISILTVEIKHATLNVTPRVVTPSGWTLIGTVTNNGTLASGTDTGSNTVAMYYKIGAAASTALDFNTYDANSAAAVIHTYSTSVGWWDVSSFTVGSDTASGANASMTGAANISITTGDWIVVGCGVSGDIGTRAGQAITATSATIGTVQNRTNASITTGADSALMVSDAPVSSGTSSAAPVFTFTNASSSTAHAMFLRLRETTFSLTNAGTPLVVGGSNWNGFSLSIVLEIPLNTANGDLLVAVCNVRDDLITVSTPAGWNLLSGHPPTSSGSGPRFYVFWKIAASESATQTFTASGDQNNSAIMVAIRYVDQTTPIEASATATVATATTAAYTATAPTVTPLSNPSLLLTVFGARDVTSGNGVWGTPSGMTKVDGATNDHEFNGNFAAVLALASTSATGSKAATYTVKTSAAGETVGTSMIIKPLSSAPARRPAVHNYHQSAVRRASTY